MADTYPEPSAFCECPSGSVRAWLSGSSFPALPVAWGPRSPLPCGLARQLSLPQGALAWSFSLSHGSCQGTYEPPWFPVQIGGPSPLCTLVLEAYGEKQDGSLPVTEGETEAQQLVQGDT